MFLDKLRQHAGLFLVVGFLFAVGGIAWEYLDTIWTVDALEQGTAESEGRSSSARGVLVSFALVAVVLLGTLAFFRLRNKTEDPRD